MERERINIRRAPIMPGQFSAFAEPGEQPPKNPPPRAASPPSPPSPPVPPGPPVWAGQNIYIRPSYIVSMPEYVGGSRYCSEAFEKNKENLKAKAHNGLLSRKAIGKMRNAINWLLCAAKPKDVYSRDKKSWFTFKVNFITLTLPDTRQTIDNRLLQTKLLNPFLTHLRKYYGLNNYVWKLEFQRNGKLHVHFTSDTFIHHRVLRTVWNRLLISNGFMLDYNQKFSGCSLPQYLKILSAGDSRTTEQKRKAWEAGTAANWLDPNTTDVHSVKKVKDLAAYLCKYMSKQAEDLIKIKGRIWGCSQALSQANTLRLFFDSSECITELKPLMEGCVDWRPIGKIDPVTNQLSTFGEIFFIKYTQWQHQLSGLILAAFIKTITAIAGPGAEGACSYFI